MTSAIWRPSTAVVPAAVLTLSGVASVVMTTEVRSWTRSPVTVSRGGAAGAGPAGAIVGGTGGGATGWAWAVPLAAISANSAMVDCRIMSLTSSQTRAYIPANSYNVPVAG